MFCALVILEIEGVNEDLGKLHRARRGVRSPRKPSARGNLGFVQDCRVDERGVSMSQRQELQAGHLLIAWL